MGNGAELRPGGVYLLDDFTVIQVVAIEGGQVRYRTRTRLWRRVRLRRVRLTRLRPRIRSEVNGDFFPGIVVPGLQGFTRPPAESAALDGHLARRAPHRPFAGS